MFLFTETPTRTVYYLSEKLNKYTFCSSILWISFCFYVLLLFVIGSYKILAIYTGSKTDCDLGKLNCYPWCPLYKIEGLDKTCLPKSILMLEDVKIWK